MTEAIHAALAGDVRRWFARRAPPDQVDDLVQDTFLKIHRGVGSLQDTDRVAPWVFRICRNVLVDHLRRQRPYEEVPEIAVEVAEPEATTTVASWLPLFLESLPEAQREALRLSELEGVSQAELARRLQISPSGARSRVQRGRVALREALEDCCRIGFEGGEVVSIDRQCGC